MFLVSYDFTFDAGMRLLLLLLRHRQQHWVDGAVRIGWHNARQDLPANPPRMVKIKRSIKYRHLQFLTCSTSIVQLHAQNNNNFSG